MSKLLINEYLREISRLKRASGSETEEIIREAFKDLLKAWSRQKGLVFLAEKRRRTAMHDTIKPDGTFVYEGFETKFGFWEAKDPADNLDREIQKKIRAGYPQMNIIFENSNMQQNKMVKSGQKKCKRFL